MHDDQSGPGRRSSAHAIGLVTDIGGILGHGSIVAREYGIPAVVGTGTVTQRLEERSGGSGSTAMQGS